MDVGLFLLGALGALLIVYLAKQEVIPEFRPLVDTAKMEAEAETLRENITKTQQEINDIQAQLSKPVVDASLAGRLGTVITTSQSELKDDRERLQTLEKSISLGQLISRGLGFIFYIVLGGVFGALLANRVKVEGISGDLPSFFQSILIGATWTTYLSTIGLRLGQTKADEQIEAGKKNAANQIEAFKKEILPKVEQAIATVEMAEEAPAAVKAPEMRQYLDSELDKVNATLQENWNKTRSKVKREVKGIL